MIAARAEAEVRQGGHSHRGQDRKEILGQGLEEAGPDRAHCPGENLADHWAGREGGRYQGVDLSRKDQDQGRIKEEQNLSLKEVHAQEAGIH